MDDPKPTLGTLPTEILHDICSILALEDRPSCSCLSRSAKRMYALATPYLYGTITTRGLRVVRGEVAAQLLRTMLSNQALASLVTEIDFFTPLESMTPFNTGHYRDTFLEAERRIDDAKLWTDVIGSTAWVAHMIAVTPPNLRSLQYRLGNDEDCVAWQALLTSALKRSEERPLFPDLRKVAIGLMYGYGVNANWLMQGLFDAAPNIEELTLDKFCKLPSPSDQFRHIKTLHVSDHVLHSRRGLRRLIRCCPELRSFALTYCDIEFQRDFNPQKVVDLLEPVAGQLTELRLRPAAMSIRDAPSSGHRAGISLSFKSLRALEVLEVDAGCFWAVRWSWHEKPAMPLWGEAGCLVESLPAGLRKLTFAAIELENQSAVRRTARRGRRSNLDPADEYAIDVYDRDHSIDGLVRFGRRVKQHCPQLRSVRYGFNPTIDACLEEELLKLQRVFAEEEISFSSESLYPGLYTDDNENSGESENAENVEVYEASEGYEGYEVSPDPSDSPESSSPSDS